MPNRPGRNITPRVLTVITAYLEGHTAAETAAATGVTVETVRSALGTARYALRIQGATGIDTAIGLRRELRKRGLINHLPLI